MTGVWAGRAGEQDAGMKKLLVALACTCAAACSGGSSTPAAAGGDKAVCSAFQVVADALNAQDAPRARSALTGLRKVAGSATTPALKADATGLATATDGSAAAGFGQKLVVDCKTTGHPLTQVSTSPTP
jgi:hypothetical protein